MRVPSNNQIIRYSLPLQYKREITSHTVVRITIDAVVKDIMALHERIVRQQCDN